MINPIYKKIGKRIQSLRNSNGLTQESLAHQIGLTRTSMVHIENGNQRLTIDRLYKLAEILKVAVYNLLPEVENINEQLDAVSRERVNRDTQRQIISIIEKTKRRTK